MKKQVKKIVLKTDKVANLSNAQAQNVAGGARPIPTITRPVISCLDCY